ncbi:response regulator [Flavobacterium gelidilacus]|jgi:CheY-like chemotaxis protein|uniref:response regulator n=1 Tax=Flavobacterium gelidilacus TaxID=206041 RepID=UPI0003F8475B|nr:response regulator [Flavobacterium gelidilacus]
MTFNTIEKSILLVEDNPIDLDLTLRAFTAKNISNPIQIARDGEEAMQYLERWENGEPTPIVILLDLNMPKINGLEVLEKLKSHPEFKAIPVVILTTSSESSDLQKAYKLGVNSYIVKPVSFENFLDVVGHIDLYWRLINKSS